MTVTGVTNGVVSFAFTANNFANRTAHIALLGQSIAVTQMGPPNYLSVGTTNLLEGPNAGSDSVVLAVNSSWTATANDFWLHLTAANQSGMGSANVIFAFDANPGATRKGTLTIAGQTVTVTQAGSTYIAITNATTLVSSGLNYPSSVAVDGSGNVFIADAGNNAIKEWMPASNTVTTLASWKPNTNLFPDPITLPYGVAVDGAGNVFIAEIVTNSVIEEWLAASNTIIPLVSWELIPGVGWGGLTVPPFGLAADGAGNVYITESSHNTIAEFTVANSNITAQVSSGSSYPTRRGG